LKLFFDYILYTLSSFLRVTVARAPGTRRLLCNILAWLYSCVARNCLLNSAVRQCCKATV